MAAGPDHGEMSWRYSPQPYSSRIVQFLSTGGGANSHSNPRLQWEGLAGGGVEVHQLADTTVSMLRDPDVNTLAEKLSTYLGAVALGAQR